MGLFSEPSEKRHQNGSSGVIESLKQETRRAANLKALTSLAILTFIKCLLCAASVAEKRFLLRSPTEVTGHSCSQTV